MKIIISLTSARVTAHPRMPGTVAKSHNFARCDFARCDFARVGADSFQDKGISRNTILTIVMKLYMNYFNFFQYSLESARYNIRMLILADSTEGTYIAWVAPPWPLLLTRFDSDKCPRMTKIGLRPAVTSVEIVLINYINLK